MKKSILFWVFALKTLIVFAQQKTIKFHNPSFEHTAPNTKPPKFKKTKNDTLLYLQVGDLPLLEDMGWSACGFENTSPPDVQPGRFGVTAKAAHGKSYISMVTRADKSWEGLSQKLPETLKKDSCYQFSISLMRAPNMASATTKSDSARPFVAACRLAVYGGRKSCSGNILVETAPIQSSKWVRYKLQFKPKEDIKWIYFEAFYSGKTPENGNILLDDLSDIELIPCKE
jgi:hypothetical protein